MSRRIIAFLLCISMILPMFTGTVPVAYAEEQDTLVTSSTEAPTTEVPTTEVPTTEVPATEVPATEVPTTEVPATEVPTTEVPTTEVPTTEVPTTEVHATEAPATEAPSTEIPTTEASTTETLEAPATEAPAAEVSTKDAPVALDFSGDVGKYVQLNSYYENDYITVHDGTNAFAMTDAFVFEYSDFEAGLIFKITDWYLDPVNSGLWYQVEAYQGNLPEDMLNGYWIFQNYMSETAENMLVFVTVEEPEETCPICGQVDCDALHFYCEICKKYDCGLSHPYCNLCGVYDCEATHVWCGTCGTYDCGQIHEDIYTPLMQPEIPENPTLIPNVDVSITDASGNPAAVTGIRIAEGTKISLSAWTEQEEDEVSYQWQIRYDEANDLWVDIQGQTGKGILVSPAMFRSILQSQGSAAIRCAVTFGATTQFSDAIPLTVAEQGRTVSSSGSSDSGIDTIAEGDNTLTKAYVVVQYVYADGRTAAATQIAEIVPGAAYSHPYDLPDAPGYKATLKDESSYDGKVAIVDDKLQVNYAKGDLTEEYTQIVVEYVVDFVGYTIIHYHQNVNDDNYTEFERQVVEKKDSKYKTGEIIGNVHKDKGTDDDPNPNYDADYAGFYHLLYESPAAAADGSTVIEVYYDRYYYLMKFDLGDMGYGVDPIYDRVGADIEVGIPTRHGYTFDGWLDENGQYVVIADTMPVGGTTYTAKWTKADAHYTVSYWIVNDDGTRTLIGSYLATGTSGDQVNGWDNLGAKNSQGQTVPQDKRGVICGEEATHIHMQDCYGCGYLEHVHTNTCFGTLEGYDPGDNGRAAIAALGNGNPESGYVYVVKLENGNMWPKFYFNGTYYALNGVGYGNPATEAQVNTIITGEALGEKSGVYNGEALTVIKYEAKTTCGYSTQHTHVDACRTCVLHSHTSDCYYDTKHVEYRDTITVTDKNGNPVTYTTDKNVTVNGDGSSMVNVYYTYKIYTIRFIYAKQDGTGFRLATSTGNGKLEGNGGCSWNAWHEINNLPTFDDPDGAKTRSSVKIGSNTYYYISLTAKYGENIAAQWPDANIGAVGNYEWGSWGAAPGTGYRETYGDAHANIVGPYPVMSDDMIVENPESLGKDENGNNIYLAQNMVAWWAGRNDNVENHAYHIYYEVLPSQKGETGNVTYRGKEYKLVTTYTFTAAHNGTTRVDPIFFNGFVCINDTSAEDYKGEDTQENSENFPSGDCSICKSNKCNWHNNFYYDRNVHKLYFWNRTDFLLEGKGSDVPFGASLDLHEAYVSDEFMAKPENYPSGLEPNAYQFDGWYTSGECLPGTEMDWNTTMPDADMTVYAKWIPAQRSVKYYLNRDSLDRNEDIPTEMARLVQEALANGTISQAPTRNPYAEAFAEDIVLHGGFIPKPDAPETTEGYEDIHPRAGYEFVGWFYLDENGEEAAFDPENMPVNQDLSLYGKWSANVLCKYNVYFAMAATDAEGKLLMKDGKPYPAVDGEGNIIYVADAVSGSGLAGRTFTFTAKGGKDLYTNYQEGYFPIAGEDVIAGSHSLVLQAKDTEGVAENSYFFLYLEKPAVPYTVRYLEKGTNKELAPPKVISDNKKVVVTENFVTINQYIPDDYQKTLVVTAEGGTENVITFWYTKDEQHALYVVNHYIQNLNEDLSHAGWSVYTSLKNPPGIIGEKYSANAVSIDGYTLSAVYTDQYNRTEEKNGMTGADLPTKGYSEISALTDSEIEGILGKNGMELNFYYTRDLYPYEFRFMLNGTTTKLADSVFGKAGFDMVVTQPSKNIKMDLDNDGIYEDYQLYDTNETSKEIRIKVDGEKLKADAQVTEGQAKVNIATFYYVRCTQTMTITKQVVGKNADTDSEFEFSLTINAKDGYHRTGYAYQKNNGQTGTLSYNVVDNKTLYFKLKHGESITIEGLPTAEYTLTELNVPVGYYDTYSSEHRGENGCYKLTVNEPVNVTVTNTYDPTVLEISKTVDVVEENNKPEVSDFEFTITVPAGVTGTFDYTIGDASHETTVSDGKMTITLKDGETAKFVNLPCGNYTVTEKDYSALGYKSHYVLNGVKPLVESLSAGISMERGKTQSVAFVNAFPVGDLTIQKTVTKEFHRTPWTGDTFTFVVERTTDGRPLKAGNQYWYKIDGVLQKITVDGEEQNAVLTVGDDNKLLVSIAFTNEDAEILNADGASRTHTLTIINLPAGTYQVTESEISANKDANYIHTPEGRTVSGKEIPAEEVPVAEFTNTLIRPTNDITLMKELVPAEGYPEDKLPTNIAFTFVFQLVEKIPAGTKELQVIYVTSTEDENGNTQQITTEAEVLMENGRFELEVARDQTVTIKGVPIGKYRITEVTVPRYANEFTGIGCDVEQGTDEHGNLYAEVDVTKDGEAKIKCVNTYPVDLADMTIVRSNAEADQVFVYEVKNNTSGKIITVVVVGEGSTTIHDLPLGEYTVTQKNDWSWRYEDAEQTVDHTSNGSTVKFEAAATKDSWLNGNSLPVTNTKAKGG